MNNCPLDDAKANWVKWFTVSCPGYEQYIAAFSMRDAKRLGRQRMMEEIAEVPKEFTIKLMTGQGLSASHERFQDD